MDGLDHTCRPCKAVMQHRWYESHREEHRARITKRKRAMALEYLDRMYEYLIKHPCVDCGERDPAVLEFDHRDRGAKELEISAMMVGRYNWVKIVDEIAKCDVRCANCHKRRTARQLGWTTRLAWGKRFAAEHPYGRVA